MTEIFGWPEKRCLQCGGPLPPLAVKHGDDYCTTECARGLDERTRLGVPDGHDVYGTGAFFADRAGMSRWQFLRYRTGKVITAPQSPVHLVPLNSPGWFATTASSEAAFHTTLSSTQAAVEDQRRAWAADHAASRSVITTCQSGAVR